MTETQTVTASTTNYSATPRKMRLLADFVRGKTVRVALAELSFINKRHTDAMMKLISSAIANAKHNNDVDAAGFVISDIQVQEGKSMKRHRAGARGQALVFKKRLSHINVTLSPKTVTLSPKTD